MLGTNITQPLIGVLGIIIVMAGFGLLVSAVNDWTLMTYDAGVIDGQRIDRVVGFDGAETADEAWYDNTLTNHNNGNIAAADGVQNNRYYVLSKSGTDKCILTSGTVTTITATGDRLKAYTQNGLKVDITTAGLVSGCEWTPAAGVWSVGGFKDLVRLVFQATSLGLPIGVLFVLYTFGNKFLTGMGINPIIAVIVLIIAFLLATRLLDALMPYIDQASDALGSVRFLVYQEGLGKLSVLIRNFYAIVVAASMLKLGWEAIKLFRGAGDGMGASLGGGMSGRM